MTSNLENNLRMLGLEISEDRRSRSMFILRTLLVIQLDSPEPLSFAQIYDAVNDVEEGLSYSKAWVHRLLKELVDKDLVKTTSNSASRRMYVCDINTLMTGIKKIKADTIEDLTNQMEESQATIDLLESLDSNDLAQQVFAQLTGKFDTPSSRFLTGIDELHHVTDETIYSAAKEGDIIRCSVFDVNSFINGVNNRIGRIITTPALGAEIRYAVTSEVFQMDPETTALVPEDWLLSFTKGILQMQGRGLDFRIVKPKIRGYQFVSLNKEIMALMISHNPVTAAWVTRKFNANLIDNVISSFDRDWEEAIPIDQIKPEDFKTLGVDSDSYMVSILERGLALKGPDER